VLEEDHAELVFWCRGRMLEFDVRLDGEPLGIDVDGSVATSPMSIAASAIATLAGSELGWPDRGRALLWLEAGVEEMLPVVPTPEEIEHLRELGYTR